MVTQQCVHHDQSNCRFNGGHSSDSLLGGGFAINEEPLWPQLLVFIASGYVFKLVVAALDTGPIYLAVRYLRGYLGLG